MNEIQSPTSSLGRLIYRSLMDAAEFGSKENVIGMTTADNGEDARKVTICEYAKVETGLGEFELSIRECGNQPCPQSIFSIPSIYEKCPYRLKYQKEGLSVNQSEPKEIFVRVHSKQESAPKFTGIALTAVNTRQVLTVGVNVHTTFGRENLIGSFLGVCE